MKDLRTITGHDIIRLYPSEDKAPEGEEYYIDWKIEADFDPDLNKVVKWFEMRIWDENDNEITKTISEERENLIRLKLLELNDNLEGLV